MTPYLRLLRLVLLVSSAHAMVHLLEQSIASVEQIVSDQFELTRRQSGLLGTAFRFPYGVGAILAGMLADRLGAHRVLAIYLAGAAVTCVGMAVTQTATAIYFQLFVLGCFASMYHPAGLALLANSTTPAERTRALGLHGVFGSTGIAAAPFLAGVTLSIPGVTWKGYYLLLGLLSGFLAWLVVVRLRSSTPLSPSNQNDLPISAQVAKDAAAKDSVAANLTGDVSSVLPAVVVPKTEPAKVRLQRFPYAALVISTGLSGIVYGGFLHFLKRYLSEVPELMPISAVDYSGRDVAASYYTAIVLICGAAGQFLIGRLASARHLPQLLSLSYASNAPLLIWMSFAEGNDRLVATCLLAFAHFTNQPLYNSLLPEYIPPDRRSTWFGVSNMMGFGVGAIGPSLVGSFSDYRGAYQTLAVLSLIAAMFPAMLWLQSRRLTRNR